jgi:hypothetical protein
MMLFARLIDLRIVRLIKQKDAQNTKNYLTMMKKSTDDSVLAAFSWCHSTRVSITLVWSVLCFCLAEMDLVGLEKLKIAGWRKRPHLLTPLQNGPSDS